MVRSMHNRWTHTTVSCHTVFSGPLRQRSSTRSNGKGVQWQTTTTCALLIAPIPALPTPQDASLTRHFPTSHSILSLRPETSRLARSSQRRVAGSLHPQPVPERQTAGAGLSPQPPSSLPARQWHPRPAYSSSSSSAVLSGVRCPQALCQSAPQAKLTSEANLSRPLQSSIVLTVQRCGSTPPGTFESAASRSCSCVRSTWGAPAPSRMNPRISRCRGLLALLGAAELRAVSPARPARSSP